MKRNKINKGTLPPLFDRIIEDKSGQGRGQQLLNAQQLKDSIIHELSIALNTRCTVRKVIYKDHIETIPFFGMPDFFGLGDFSGFDGENSQTWPSIAHFIQTAIHAAEPRIKDVRVTIEGYDSINQSLSIDVAASLKESKLISEIHFPLTLLRWGSTSKKAAA
ncbi:MAG: type VI secretion system baseplate subunit TssE [Proteobacteria bacterium]|nr:type VI secretion system baseplate subunit TssE [Pseudomonadota bacterium]